jgi:hypothetical protein
MMNIQFLQDSFNRIYDVVIISYPYLWDRSLDIKVDGESGDYRDGFAEGFWDSDEEDR